MYGALRYDSTLVGPTNNASLTRMFPDAAESFAAAKVLLFSNSNSRSGRTNGTVRYSCDDGTTWSAGKTFKAGAMSYSTMTALSDGTVGLFYEGDSNTMTFAKLNSEWIGANGATADAAMTVSNTSDAPLSWGAATFAPQAGWVFGTVALPTIAAHGQAMVSVPVDIPAYAKADATSIAACVTVAGHVLGASVPVTVTGGSTETIAGESVPYAFAVASTGNISESVVPQTGNFKPFVPADTYRRTGQATAGSLPWRSGEATAAAHPNTWSPRPRQNRASLFQPPPDR